MPNETATHTDKVAPPPPEALPRPAAAGGWELARQCRRALRTLRWGAIIVALLLAIVVLSEAVRYYDLFARVHWLLGCLYLFGVVAVLAFFVGLPLWRYLRIPPALSPPDVHLDAESITPDELTQRVRFVHRYCRCLLRNPELADKKPQIQEVVEAAARVRRQAAASQPPDRPQLIADLQKIEIERVDTLLKELDDRVDAYIRKEALGVGVATTISMNGTLDAFIVLWRNANMVTRIGRYYYGRPGLRGNLTLLRDVASVVVLSRAMDDLSDKAGDLLGGALGQLGRFLGPVVDGTVNALMTMRVGYLAKRRCRSFEPWSDQTARRALVEVIRHVSAERTIIVKELSGRFHEFGACAAAAARKAASTGAEALAARGKSAWDFLTALFGPGPEPEPS